ncbi:MAG: DUF1080 domain-containing protein [Ekhidna sp.]|nr:DUF1080 domain-containing protein [Ekhidna sp.]MBC6409779.1 DUF1080 domain-containing protein [Ekhidna sp.]
MKQSMLIVLSFIVISCSPKEEWTPLFNGEDLDGWHIYLKGKENYNGWYVDSGVLAFDPAGRTVISNADLVTDQRFTNFELSIEWMISEKGNSGIFWGVKEDTSYQHTYETGPEIQVLDDNWTEYIEERGDIQRAGSVFNIIAPSRIASKPAGEWNHYLIHIDHIKNEGFVLFNRVEIMRFPVNGPEWEELISNSGFKNMPGFGKEKTGHIALQDHGNQVAYRNIRIRKLM